MMRWMRRLQLRLRSLTRGTVVDRELQRELRLHLEAAIEEHRAAGLSDVEARRRAYKEFGNLAAIEEACRDTRRVRLLENLGRDTRYALRQLRREPVFALAAVAAVALGVGANVGIFGLANDLLLSAPTAARVGELVHIRTDRGSHVSYEVWRRLNESGALAGVAGYTIEDQVNWRSGDIAMRLTPLVVTPNYFDVLGLSAAMGRPFTAAQVRQSPDVVVISHGFWRQHLGGDPDVVGRPLTLNGRSYTTLAVLPEGLRALPGYGVAPDVYLPLGRALMPNLDDPNAAAAMLVGRLREGQTLAEGRDATAGVLAGVAPPQREESRLRVFEPVGGLSQLREFKEVALFFGLLLALSLLVFFIACANVAGLLLARGAHRQREMALRLALGAGRRRLIQQLLTEGAVLAVIGTTCGLLLALAAGRALGRLALPLPVPLELHVTFGGRLFFVAVGLLVLGTLLSSLLPALRATRPGLAATLKTDLPPGLGGRLTFRRLIVAAQVAVSCLLVVIAALFLRNLTRIAAADPGFDTARTLVAQVAFVEGRQVRGGVPAIQSMTERIRALPGVDSAAIARGIPLTLESLSTVGTEIRIDGRPGPVRVDYEENSVGPDYFRAIGIRLLHGRAFDDGDRTGAPAVVIVSAEFARRYLDGLDPVGARLHLPGPPDPRGGETTVATTIVGVVADSRHRSLGEDLRAAIYTPYLQRRSIGRQANVVVRVAGPPSAMVDAVRDTVLADDGSVAVTVQPMSSALTFAFLPSRIGAWLTASLGLVGLLLCAVGLHGVIAYATGRRFGEIGIRLTLGASRGAIVRLVLADTAAVSGLGVIAGLGLAYLATPLVATFLVGTLHPMDPVSLVLTVVLVVAVSLAASWGPLRRALRVDPSIVLRSQ